MPKGTPAAMRLRRPFTALAVLAVLAVAALLAAPDPATAQTTKPRIQAEEIPGTYIQGEPLWIPVLSGQNRVIYQGLAVRFTPTAEGRVQTCMMVPQFMDWILVDFTNDPPDRATAEDPVKLRARMEAVVVGRIGRGVLRGIDVLIDHQPPEGASVDLTLACK